ncbi:hypothetical protein N2152v2_007703 [Parachlorella kessleri]
MQLHQENFTRLGGRDCEPRYACGEAQGGVWSGSDCVAAAQKALGTCDPERQAFQQVYDWNATAAPTPGQVQQSTALLKQASLPSSGCCQIIVPYAQQRCPCNPDIVDVLPSIGMRQEGLKGVTAILQQACQSPVTTC